MIYSTFRKTKKKFPRELPNGPTHQFLAQTLR